MKKIISALALSAFAFGAVSASTKVSMNYRNGAYLMQYKNDGEENSASSTTFGALNTYQGGQDSLTLTASGDHLTFKATIQPKLDSTLRFNQLSLAGKWGNFEDEIGWNGDGINGGYRVTNDASNWEGIFFERWKLGSMFKLSTSQYADNQVEVGNGQLFTNRIMFERAAYTIKADDLAIKLQGVIISDRGWKASNVDTEYNAGNKGWSALVDVSKKGVFKAEAIVKGAEVGKTGKVVVNKGQTDGDGQALAIGVYVQPLMVKGLIATVGGAVSVYDGEVTDWSADLRARYAVNDALSLTYYGKLSALTDSVDDNVVALSTNIGFGSKTSITTNTAMWNMLNARYKVNDLITASLNLSAVTDLKNKDDTNAGTTLGITPGAEFFAAKNATITIGVNATFGGLGAEEKSAYKKEMDLGICVPVLFRVKL